MNKRIFDIAASNALSNPDLVALASKVNGEWKEISAKELWTRSELLASGLIKLGISNENLDVEAVEKIAIVSHNRPEWIILDLAVQQTGALLVPIYPTISPSEFAYILNHAGVKKIFFEDKILYKRFSQAFNEVPSLEHIFTFEKVDKVDHWESILGNDQSLKRLREKRDEIDAKNTATIIYTSGTTGKPKGVMLSHFNILSNIRDTKPVFNFVSPGEKALSFLPLNHVFERTLIYIYLNSGISVYFAEGLETILPNLKEVKPVIFTCVPRLLEKVYQGIVNKGESLTGIQKSIFFWALKLANQYDNRKPKSIFYNAQMALADKLIFSKWREALGGNIKAIVCGAAALSPKYSRVFTGAGITVMEGYGLTETSPVISVNTHESAMRKIGTVGLPLQNIQVKIAEDGEICIKGDNVMQGYYKQPDLTEQVFDQEGWFLTGDVGILDEGKFIKITDRKKEIFKTSGGKYVAPQPIESKLSESPFIEQIMLVGEGEKYVSALIVPNYTAIIKKLSATESNLPTSRYELAKNEKVRKVIREVINQNNPSFNQVEQVKKFTLLPNEWTVEDGILTPKLSLRRKVVMERYANIIKSMYK